jgi:membrane protein DedA with SNARE-associated domain
MFDFIDTYVLDLIHVLPLTWFVLVGSFIEEVIAPVPALAVMLLAGSAAALQDLSPIDLISLALIAALSKTLGSIIVYSISDKGGQFVLGKFGWLFRVSVAEVQAFGKKLKGDQRDYVLLITLRTLPIVPSSLVSIGCGLLQIPLRLFLISTFLGTIIRDGLFLYVGYSGIALFESLATQTATIESFLQTAFIIVVAMAFGYIYYKRRQVRK